MKQRKTKYPFLILSIFVIAVILLAAYTTADSKISRNIDQRAFDELESSVRNHAAYISQTTERMFDPLETLSYYLGAKDNVSFGDCRDLTDAVVLANHLCMLGFADMNGDAVSYEGEDLGNIADREYFKNAIRWSKGENTIVYMQTTAKVAEPRILFSVPVLKKNVMVGVLFAAMELPDFDAMLVADNFDGKEVVFVTDSSGNIIMKNENGDKHITGANLFDDYLSKNMLCDATVESIRTNMMGKHSGTFCLNNDEKEYVAYAPIGINDWYVFSMASSGVANTKYRANQQQFKEAVNMLTMVFTCSMLCTILFVVYYVFRMRKTNAELRVQKERYDTVLQEIDKAVFDLNCETQKLAVSEPLEKILGYSLPADWFSVLPSRSKEHAEFDYKALLEQVALVKSTGKRAEITLQVQSGHDRLRWIRITMIPQFKGPQLSNIFGVIADVTEKHDTYAQIAQEQADMAAALFNLSPLIVSANLTQNSYHLLSSAEYTARGIPDYGSFDELVAQTAAAVPEEDREDFLRSFSLESLLQSFSEGKEAVELLHRQTGDDGATRWIRSRCVRVFSEFNDDMRMIVTSQDVGVEKQYENMTERKDAEMRAENAEKYGDAFHQEESLYEQADGMETDFPDSQKKVFARTFGYFDLFVNGKPLHFTSAKGKELLAILIDRNGGTLSTEEAIGLLWENEPAGEKQMARYRRLASRLKATLQEAGIDDILINQHGVRSINASKVDCDYWEAIRGNEGYQKMYQGAYMINYTWAEETAAHLEQLFGKNK